MKNLLLGLGIAVFIALLFSCNVTDSDSNSLGGDTDVPMGQVGNVFSNGSLNIAGDQLSYPVDATIIENNNGIATINVKIDMDEVKNHAMYKQYNSTFNLDNLVGRIPEEFLDNDGNIDADLKFKITSEGIQDYVNRDGKAHTLVKFDANVGDEFNLKKSGGQILKRKVTQKSTEDDFPYGFFYIKTITVEQPSNYPGVSKFVYKANHRFGLVYAEAVFEDGSKASSYLYSQYDNSGD